MCSIRLDKTKLVFGIYGIWLLKTVGTFWRRAIRSLLRICCKALDLCLSPVAYFEHSYIKRRCVSHLQPYVCIFQYISSKNWFNLKHWIKLKSKKCHSFVLTSWALLLFLCLWEYRSILKLYALYLVIFRLSKISRIWRWLPRLLESLCHPWNGSS